MGVELGDEPIDDNFGRALTRLNPDEGGEVVWGQRIDPVRLRIENVPLPGSGYRLGDVVLHDGAYNGTRIHDGQEYFVFNALMLHQPSHMTTFELDVEVDSAADVSTLEAAIEVQGGYAEDWTASLRPLCKACSEGTPHDHHEPPISEAGWATQRRLGVGMKRPDDLKATLQAWESSARRVVSLDAVLTPPNQN